MDNLYVCLFSSGHIKVGRALDPNARISQHADRVACMGVEVSEYRGWPVVGGSAAPHEQRLIDRCAAAASQRFKSEWFVGLDFAQVCAWAEEIAGKQIDTVVPFKAIREMLCLTQAELAEILGCTQGNVSLMDKGQVVMPDTAIRLVSFAAQRGFDLSLDQVYGLRPISAGWPQWLVDAAGGAA